MSTSRAGYVGAVLLIAGGVLEAAVLAVGALTDIPSITPISAIVSVADVAAWPLIGTGLITIGYWLDNRGRIATKIAGVLAWIVGIVEAAQFIVGSHYGPAPAFYTFSAYLVAVLIAGLRILSDQTLRRTARWSIAVPAICGVAGIAIGYTPLIGPALSLPGVALPWVGFAAAGLLLIKAQQYPSVAGDRLVLTH